MPSGKQKKGFAGESIAADMLREKGYFIVDRNYRYGKAEIDLIAFFPDRTEFLSGDLVFVEVKWRRDASFAAPESAVGSKKRRLLIRAAEAFVYKNKLEDLRCRFDIVSLAGMPPCLSIEHYESAFTA